MRVAGPPWCSSWSPVLQSLGLGMSWEQTLTVWIAGLNGSFNIIMGMMASEDLAAVNNGDFGDFGDLVGNTVRGMVRLVHEAHIVA